VRDRGYYHLVETTNAENAMTPGQKNVYELCVASHDRLRAHPHSDSFARHYNNGYNFPDAKPNQMPRAVSTSLADAAFRAGRDRRRHDDRKVTVELTTLGWSDRGNEWTRPTMSNDHLVITNQTWLHYRWGTGPGLPDVVLGKGEDFTSLKNYLANLK
jgi:hypothetical protein